MRLGLLSSILLAYPPPQQPPPGHPPPGYPPPGYPPPQGYPPPPPGYPPPPGGQRSGKLTAAGILNIIGGIIGIILFIWILVMFAMVGEAADDAGAEDAMGGIFAWGIACGVIALVGAISAFIGGMLALQRKSWGLCLVTTIIGLILANFLFCLIALILIAISKDEFYS